MLVVANQERGARGLIRPNTTRGSTLDTANSTSADTYHDQVSNQICRPGQGLSEPGFARVVLVGDGYAGGMQRRCKSVGEPSVMDFCF